MKKLNRYVLSAFLKPLFLSYAAMTLLVLTAEVMEKLDKIIANKVSLIVTARYLLALWPVRSLELFPVSALLATLFSLGQLSRQREVTAAMAGGVHPWKIVSPLLLVGVMMSVFSWGLGEALIPWAQREVNKTWNEDIRRIISRRETRFSQVTAAGEGLFYAVQTLDTQAQKMEGVLIDEVSDNGPVRQWQAQEALWTPKGWTLVNGVERLFSNGNALAEQIPFKEKQTSFTDKPSDLVPKDVEPEEMNMREIIQYIRRLKILGMDTRRAEVEKYMKTALPWANLIILVLGIPFSFNKQGGKVRAVGVALGTAFAYFGLLQVGRAMGLKPWCPPFAAGWMANAVFLLIGATLFWRMRSLS